MTKDEVMKIIKEASEALSHASYCGITGAKVNRTAILNAWDPLRALIDEMEPKANMFRGPQDEGYKPPTLAIVELHTQEPQP